MAVDWDAVTAVTIPIDIAGGLLFTLVGVFVATRKPRTPLMLAFGIFAILYGIGVALNNLGNDLGAISPWWLAPGGVCFSLAGIALTRVAHLFPSPLEGRPRWWLIAGAFLAIEATLRATRYVVVDPLAGSSLVFGLGTGIIHGARALLLAMLALRYAEAGPKEEPAIVAVSVAFGIEAALRMGFGLAILASPNPRPFSEQLYWVAASITVTGLAGLWVRNAARATRPESARRARDVVLILLAIALAGSLFAVATDPEVSFNLGPIGIARIAGVIILASAVAKGAIPGFDARIRWAVSRSTLGALFIAAFFVVSKIAENYFQSSLGPVLGVAAAGLLVFALAPLQRVADRVASAAIPTALAPATLAPDSPQLRAYRAAVRAAVTDGRITHAEELHLAEVAQELGIGAADALRERRDVENEGAHATHSQNP